jgi:type I restriction enzyme, S subunit
VSTPFLKPGWRIVRFGEIVENVREQVKPVPEDSAGYIGLEHLDPGSLHLRRWGTEIDMKGQKLRMKKGDLLFARRNAYLRRVAIAPHDGLFSAHGMVMRPKPETVLPEFLPFFLQSDMFMERAIEISVGSLSPTINWKTLRVQEFPLPPIGEQKCIAEILWAADEVVERSVSVNDAIEKSRRVALFDLMMEGAGPDFRGITAHSATGRWNVERVGKAGEVQLGRQRAPKYQSGKWTRPYLRVANVFDGYFDLSDVLRMDFDKNDLARYKLDAGDILLNEGQSRELVGRCAMWDQQIQDCCFQNTLLRFRCGANLLPNFAFAYFQYLFYRQTFAAVARQTTSIAHLGADTFSRLYMPVPPLKEQDRIETLMDQYAMSRKATVMQLEKARDMLRATTNSLVGIAHV